MVGKTGGSESDGSRVIRRLLVPLVLAACVLAGLGLNVAAASASVVPVVQANTTGWLRPSVEPGHIYIGQGGSPYVQNFRWTYWTSVSAWASGELVKIKVGCTLPTYLCPVTRRWVAVYLSSPKAHGSQVFFTGMRWRYYSGGVKRIRTFSFQILPGASVPSWVQLSGPR
jgi:hypothetical protein